MRQAPDLLCRPRKQRRARHERGSGKGHSQHNCAAWYFFIESAGSPQVSCGTSIGDNPCCTTPSLRPVRPHANRVWLLPCARTTCTPLHDFILGIGLATGAPDTHTAPTTLGVACQRILTPGRLPDRGFCFFRPHTLFIEGITPGTTSLITASTFALHGDLSTAVRDSLPPPNGPTSVARMHSQPVWPIVEHPSRAARADQSAACPGSTP